MKHFSTTKELAKALEVRLQLDGVPVQIVRSSSMPNRVSLTLLKGGVVHRVDYTKMVNALDVNDLNRLIKRITELGAEPERVVYDYTRDFKFSGKGIAKEWRKIVGGN